MVLLVGAEMLRQLVDPPRQHRDLHPGRAGVRRVRAELADQLLLGFLRERHLSSPSCDVTGGPPPARRGQRPRPRLPSGGRGALLVGGTRRDAAELPTRAPFRRPPPPRPRPPPRTPAP